MTSLRPSLDSALAPPLDSAPGIAHAPWRTTIVEDIDVTYVPSAANDRAVRRWLYATMLSVIAVLVVGGITRLTESGLSITVWKPITGVLPPLSESAWQHAFEQYQ